MLTVSNHPARHFILDDFLSRIQCQQLLHHWPDADWAGWHRYDPSYEAKAASNLTEAIPAHLSVVLARMASCDYAELLDLPGVVPDLSLVGGGLHEMPPGGVLGTHLDADSHARLGLRRAFSAVCYLSEWQPGDGGELVLCGASRQEETGIEPRQGRLVAFDCRYCWHRVEKITGKHPRRSLALFGYLPEVSPRFRTRALFEGVKR